jgi:hypothetical protein
MYTYARKPTTAQRSASARTTTPVRLPVDTHRDAVNSILHARHTSLNLTGKRPLQKGGECIGVAEDFQNTARFSHDRGHIPVSADAHRDSQSKLKISAPGDFYERQADKAADHVLSASFPVTGLQALSSGDSGPPRGEACVAPASVDQVLATPGESLHPALQNEMARRLRYDFSQVRLHRGLEAEASARDANAQAYTVGDHIVFGAGRYAPDSMNGKKLLIHELVHVMQQSQGGAFLQRLIRSPYPWQGVITPAIGANIRSAPDLSDPANILDSIPRGERVRVLSATGNWLRVESRYRGPVLVGYIYHTLVDDAASSSLATSVGTQMVWRPSGPGSGTTFEAWASAATETPFPAVTSTTVMNCWEAVLLAAYQAGAINWSWIHSLYVATPTAGWVSAMSRGARHTYAIPGPNPRMPQRGDLVFFDGLAHVALATGTGSEVYTFWPPPNTPFTLGGTLDKVKIFTIEALVAWWSAHMPPPPTVEFAAPAW